MVLPPILGYALTFAGVYRYPLILIGAVIEGPIVMIASGFLARNHIVTLWVVFIVLIIGDLVGDIFWYSIGYFTAEPILKKRGSIAGITIARFEVIKQLFLRNQIKILFISKIALGFGVAKGVLMAAGAVRVPFRKFIFINFMGEIILASVLISIGYLFGDTYTRLATSARPWFVGVLIVVVMVLFAWMARIIRKEFLKEKVGE
jgi:membrane protein DedA with SNARE-associated domain